MSIKTTGRVYTPKKIVNLILDKTNYKSSEILKKNIIDNSCGDGAFLIEIVNRYCDEFIKKNGINKKELLKKELEEYIHGIEIDEQECKKAILNVNKIVEKYNLSNVKWDIINANTLEIDKYNNKMDYVIGNPPYVRVHNLGDDFNTVKSKKFSNKGMTDLFIVFYELGISMLNENGKLSYITPNSIFNSLAGTNLRKYVIKEKILNKIINLGHYQPFPKITTYTAILFLDKINKKEEMNYYEYNNDNDLKYIDKLEYLDFYIDGKFYFSNKENLKNFKKISKIKKIDKIKVKNGFATLGDKIFINKKFDFKSKQIIKVVKASTGEAKEIIYPYNKNAQIMDFTELDFNLQNYFLENRENLEKRSIEKKKFWYGFGRTQAIKDVYQNKISINNLIKNKENLKIVQCESGVGVYSGLYILGVDEKEIIKILKTDDFIEYLKIIGKYKNGGYYSFSSSDLEKYIIYNIKGEAK